VSLTAERTTRCLLVKREKELVKKKAPEQDTWLFELPELDPGESEPLVNALPHPIWTENKAKLIEAYLRFFLYITRHGTYIDCFAGPQRRGKPEMWSAKLVLEMRPRWLRHFHLFEKRPRSLKDLEALKAEQPDDSQRTIDIYSGDVNERIYDLLNKKTIAEREATFCLLDQRTFECHWKTVKALAEYKTEGRKIELFYFLASKWLKRALSGVKNKALIDHWWGRDDWESLKTMKPHAYANLVVARFKNELGYKSAKPWPIFKSGQFGEVMYYMIHATDHEAAPALMRRAYAYAVTGDESYQPFFPGMEPPEQLHL
jgi:three-Cys-motif partner protein